jgi:predicted O-methyltransferase YrrM
MGIRGDLINSFHDAVRGLRTSWNRPDIYDRRSQERLGIIYSAKTHLTIADRLVLYTLVRGTKPKRVLEIGSARGGSASIMAAAMEDNGGGTIVGVDPSPLINPYGKEYFGRLTLLKESAPEGIVNAMRLAGGTFDLVFSDGPNVYDEVRKTIEAVIPCLSEGASIVVDNGLHYGVNEAVKDVIASEPQLRDCGFLSVNADVNVDPDLTYLGLLLLRFDGDRPGNPQPWIDAARKQAGMKPLHFDRKILNHDVWWCKKIQPCEKCRAQGVQVSVIPNPASR